MITLKNVVTVSNAQKVWAFVKTQLFLAIVVIGLIIYMLIQHSRINEFQRKEAISNQNQIALTDSLKNERLKSGALQTSIAGYVSTEKDLKNLNKDLYAKVKEQSGKVISLNNAVIQLIQDTNTLRKYLVEKDKIIGELVKVDSNTFVAEWTLPFKYDLTNFDIFTGKTTIKILKKNPLILKHVDTELTKRVTQIDITWGQKVEKDKLRIFIQSKYPGFTVEQLSGVLIDPSSNPFFKDLMKKKHWFQGFSIGLGTAAGFNVTKGGYGLVIGPVLSWNIYSF